MRSGIDHEVRPHLEGAKRSLRTAIASCSKVVDPKERRKAEVLKRKLSSALRMLGDAGRLGVLVEDPDLMPEELKHPGWHKRDRR
jgi:hypothetical protein